MVGLLKKGFIKATKWYFFFFIAAVPIVERDAYVISMDYSPLLAGFSIVLKDGRAAFLTSSNLKFDPNVRKFICNLFDF